MAVVVGALRLLRCCQFMFDVAIVALLCCAVQMHLLWIVGWFMGLLVIVAYVRSDGSLLL